MEVIESIFPTAWHSVIIMATPPLARSSMKRIIVSVMWKPRLSQVDIGAMMKRFFSVTLPSLTSSNNFVYLLSIPSIDKSTHA